MSRTTGDRRHQRRVRRRARILAPIGVALTSLAVAACGSSSTSANAGSGQSGQKASAATSGAQAAASKVPTTSYSPMPGKDPAIAKLFASAPSTLSVATSTTTPPAVFSSGGGAIIGFETDIVRAIGALTGKQMNITNVTFDGIIPGIQAHRYLMAYGEIGIHPDREATLDMVSMDQSGDAIVSRKSSPVNVHSLDDLCGLSVALETGSTYVGDVQAASKHCVSAGKKAITIQQYPQQANVDLAMIGGRADVEINDQLVAVYEANAHPNEFKIQAAYDVNPNGLVVAKGSPLAGPLKAALQHLINTGTYAKILKYWDSSSAAIHQAEINPIH